MTDDLFPSALREVRSDLTKRPVIIGGLALGVILGISGPFDTLRLLPALPRLAYWIVIVVLTYAIGSLVSTIVQTVMRKYAGWLRIICSACAIGVIITAFLALLNLLVFGVWYATWADFFAHIGAVFLISVVIEICAFALRYETSTQTESTNALLQRLPLDKRGGLIALSAEDHYVRVTTTKGDELVLMRLSDAVKEVGAIDGLQVHRSHWVALDQITHVDRSGDRGQATLSDGSTRPISRSFMQAVRAAGLLPKGRGA